MKVKLSGSMTSMQFQSKGILTSVMEATSVLAMCDVHCYSLSMIHLLHGLMPLCYLMSLKDSTTSNVENE